MNQEFFTLPLDVQIKKLSAVRWYDEFNFPESVKVNLQRLTNYQLYCQKYTRLLSADPIAMDYDRLMSLKAKLEGDGYNLAVKANAQTVIADRDQCYKLVLDYIDNVHARNEELARSDDELTSEESTSSKEEISPKGQESKVENFSDVEADVVFEDDDAWEDDCNELENEHDNRTCNINTLEVSQEMDRNAKNIAIGILDAEIKSENRSYGQKARFKMQDIVNTLHGMKESMENITPDDKYQTCEGMFHHLMAKYTDQGYFDIRVTSQIVDLFNATMAEAKEIAEFKARLAEQVEKGMEEGKKAAKRARDDRSKKVAKALENTRAKDKLSGKIKQFKVREDNKAKARWTVARFITDDIATTQINKDIERCELFNRDNEHSVKHLANILFKAVESRMISFQATSPIMKAYKAKLGIA